MPAPDPSPRSRRKGAASASRRVLKWGEGGAVREIADSLAEESPLEIRVDGQAVTVTMRTPGHDEELAAGFLVSEGLVASADQIAAIRHSRRNKEGNVLEVGLAPGTTIDLKKLTRHVFASSSCGLCGKATIERVRQTFPPVKAEWKISAARVASLPGELRRHQEVFDRTGGLHAAALFDPQGGIRVVREDVGRHNAVDKVIGHSLLQGQFPLSDRGLIVSGRASFEIMQKALAAGIPIVAAVSAPSTLAAEFAEESGQTLVGFVRGTSMNIYSHPWRVV